MLYLTLGLIVLACVQRLYRTTALRARLIKRYGLSSSVVGLCALCIAGVGLLVLGKSTAHYATLWLPPADLQLFVLPLTFVGFVIAAAEFVPSNFYRWLQRPLMWGGLVWLSAHLLVKGDQASVILFGGLAVLVILEIWTPRVTLGKSCSREKIPWMKESLTVAAGGSAFLVMFALHSSVFGVPPTMMGHAFF